MTELDKFTKLDHPPEIPEFAVHLSHSFKAYHQALSTFLRQSFPIIRFEEDRFGNDMPQLIVGEAEHVVMMSLLNGDNWTNALIDLFLAGYLKQAGEAGGANVEKLGLFEVFSDERMDRRGFKWLFYQKAQEILSKLLVVKGQGSFTKLLAKMAKHVTDVDYMIKLDAHSALATQQAKDEGIEVVNLTVALEMLADLEKKGYLNDELENVICGIDLGNLPLVNTIYEKYGWDVAIMDKNRLPKKNGTDSTTRSELVYGDVSGKRVILIDDMISSGGTLIETVEKLVEAGAAEIIICAAHPVFSGRDYYSNLEKLLSNEKVKVVMTTSSIPLKRPAGTGRPIDKSQPYVLITNEQSQREKKEVEIFDITPFIGMVIQALNSTGGDVEQIRNELADHLIKPADKFGLLKKLTKDNELTRKKREKMSVAGVYVGGGEKEYYEL